MLVEATATASNDMPIPGVDAALSLPKMCRHCAALCSAALVGEVQMHSLVCMPSMDNTYTMARALNIVY